MRHLAMMKLFKSAAHELIPLLRSVDDNLYLTEEDYSDEAYDPTGKRVDHYKRDKQSGSSALFFAKCNNPNETWLPLLEKAVSATSYLY